MTAIIRLGLHELAYRWAVSLLMVLVVAISLMAYLTLEGYRAGLATEYAAAWQPFLVVQQSNSLGEFKGSRLSLAAGDQLTERGVSRLIPQIHTITGTSPADAVLLRGIDLAHYRQVEAFTIMHGRALQPGDPPRLAMVGYRLAERQGVAPGGVIRLRGRDFTVAAIFRVGTYVDNEAWIALEDAQTLLGWNEEVSTFVIPDEGILREGEELVGGMVVTRKGSTAYILAQQWNPLLDLMAVIALALGIATAVTLANLLWRLALLRRRELAILRAIGFGNRTTAVYLFVQAGSVTAAGFLFGLIGTTGLAAVSHVGANGLYLPLVLNTFVLGTSLVLALLIALAGTVLPAWWLSRLNLARLLRLD
jgi:ABC-type lipoprotein release transport system permease subunit